MITQFGLKLWSTNSDIAKDAKKLIGDELFQYIELMPVPETTIEPFVSLNVPYVIHVTTEKFGLNIGDEKKHDANLRTINNCIEWADRLKAHYIILHPGFGDLNIARRFLEGISDDRILIENMPIRGTNDEAMLGYDSKQMRMLADGRFGYCLDFGHAVKAALSCGADYKTYIKDLVQLKPKVFHISDGTYRHNKDEHLGIGQGEYDIGFFLKSIEFLDLGFITLETPRIKNSYEEDADNLKAIKRYSVVKSK